MQNIQQNIQQANWKDYLQSVMLLVIATLIGELLHPFVVPTNIVMLYFLVVVIASGRWGYGPTILLSFLSVFVFNFFFVPREYNFLVTDAQDVLTFIGFFIVGVTIADLSYRVKQQIVAAQIREAQTAELYALSRDLVATIDEEMILQAVLKHVDEVFEADAAILLYDDKTLQLKAKSPNFVLDTQEINLANWAFEQNQHAGCGTEYQSESQVIGVPLVTIHEQLGVLLLTTNSVTVSQTRNRHLIDAFANQTALAIEAARLVADVQQTQILRDREQMQSVLLNSISHDLRTPLVSIAGALSTLKDPTLKISKTAQSDMIDGAWQEVQRLNRTVSNLLDMTRLESGSMQLKYDWFHVQELIANARYQLGERFRQHQLVIDVPSDLPLIELDMTLMVQVVVNLLDNAVKYSENDTQIEIHACHHNDKIKIDICDEGPGIPDGDLPYIFDRFFRLDRDGGIAGTGLGLPICQGIVKMHNGTIEVQNRPQGGSLFHIELPAKESSQVELTDESQNKNINY